MNNDFKNKGLSVTERVYVSVTENGLISHGEKILVALSGGADSVALLSILNTLSKKLNIVLFAAHLNHGIRGNEADRDERFCIELCGKMGLPIETKRVSVPDEAEKTGEGLEECARRLRYAFLEECAKNHGCQKIATAHHADDNIETVLLHLIRGSGLNGLIGISAKRENIIRPLLSLRKRELLSYLEAEQLDFVFDSTNDDTQMTRNKIRHELLETVYEINPRADVAFSNMSSLVYEDNEYLVSLARAVDKKATLCELSALPFSVLSRFLQLRYAEYVASVSKKDKPSQYEADGGNNTCESKKRPLQLSYVHLNPIAEFIKSGKSNFDFSLPGKITAHVSARGIEFSNSEKALPEYYEIPLIQGENNISQCGYKILITNDKNVADEWQNIYKLSIPASVSFGTIPNIESTGLFVRPQKSGDKYVYGGHTRNVRRRLIDLKIPAYERARIPCICDKDGIVLVPNLRVADRARPEKGRERFYIICIDTEKTE